MHDDRLKVILESLLFSRYNYNFELDRLRVNFIKCWDLYIMTDVVLINQHVYSITFAGRWKLHCIRSGY